MEFEKIDNPVIQSSSYVTVTDMGHLKEVQYLERKNTKATIIKIDKDSFYVVSSGEVKSFEHTQNRKDSLNSLRQTFKKLRYLINANFKGKPNELHVILTYAENMTDTQRLYRDFEIFLKRLKRKFKDTTIDYINVIEPQGRGAWHCHLLLRFNDLETVYIKNSELASMWGQGFVMVKSLRDVDNIGAYLSAYLADLDVSANDKGVLDVPDEIHNYVANGGHIDGIVEKSVVDDTGEVLNKKIIKGGRLHLYPTGMNIYRKSKGVVEPPREVMKYGDFRKKIGGSANPHYVSGIRLNDSENDYQNTIIYEQYNLLRQKNQ